MKICTKVFLDQVGSKFWQLPEKVFKIAQRLLKIFQSGEISPLWQIFKHLWQYIVFFGFGESFQLTLAQFVCHWANFNC